MRGNLNPFADPSAPPGTASVLPILVRFEIDLLGELDCTTGQFRGTLQNGCYDVFGTLYRFEGTIHGEYSNAGSAFESGTWDAVERPMAALFPPDPNIGGKGIWTATWVDEGDSPIAPGMGLCDGQTGFDTPP